MAKNDVSIIVTLRDQASKEFSKIGATAEGAKAKIASLRGELSGIAAGAGIAGFGMYMAKQAIEWGKAVDDVADTTGAAGEEASKLLLIGKSVGIGVEENVSAFAKFGRAVSNAKDAMAAANAKGQESNDMFSRIGLTMDDLEGKNLYEVFRKVVEQMRQMEDGADKDRAAMELFGKSGWQLHDMLNLTNEEMEKTITKAQKMGLIMNSETAAAAEKVDRQMKALTGTTNKLAIGIGTELIPVIQEKVTWLQQAVESYTAMDQSTRQAIAQAAVLAAEIGALVIVVNSAAGAMRALGLVTAASFGPWVALAGAIVMAANALYDFQDAKNKVPGYDPKAEVYTDPSRPGKHLKKEYVADSNYDELGNAQGGYMKVALSDDEEAAMIGIKRPSESASTSRVTLRPESPTGGNGSDRTQHDYEKAVEKITEMIADMNDKIVGETGTTLESNMQKVKSEIAKWQVDIDQAATKGVDTTGAQAKLDEYSKTMKDKYFKSWREAWEDLNGQLSQASAQLLDNKNAEADAELQITLNRLGRERDEKLKSVQQDKNDAEARLAVDKWYNDQSLLAKRKAEQQKRETTLEAYQQQVDHNNLLITIDGRKQTDIDVLNRKSLNDSIAYMRRQLSEAKLTADERLKIEQKLADAQKQIWEINGRDIKTGWSEAIRQYDAETINYAEKAKQSIDRAWSAIDSSTNDHLANVLNHTEKWGDGLIGVIRDVGNAISRMFADMIYQQYIMQPVKNWFSSIFGSIGGSSGGGGSGAVGSAGGIGMFAAGGVASGWSVVGEEGPELINFKNPGRVYTASDTRGMLSGGASQQITLNFAPTINGGNAEENRQSLTEQWGVFRAQFINDLKNNSAVRGAVKGVR